MPRRQARLLIQQWERDEKAPFRGWDFSYLNGRKIEEKPPWDYSNLAKPLISDAQSVLDMGTGGGEVLALLAPLPPHAVATEAYPPNVIVARQRLEPLGAKVLNVDESGKLPLTDGEFELVLNRHSAFDPAEVYRVLAGGGHFLTQQVAGGNLAGLKEVFHIVPQFEHITLDNVTNQLRQAGFVIREAHDWRGTIEFKDVGAIVYFLKAIPWIVDGFSVQTHRPYLEKLQARLDRGDKLIFTQTRFLVLAQKPSSNRL